MSVDLLEIKRKTVSVNEYIDNLESSFREKFLTTKRTYQLKLQTINRLKEFSKEYWIVTFSAEWCKDCAANIPVLALMSEATGLEVRVFGGLKKDPLNLQKKWRIPPSPSEVETFHVDKIPLMIVFDKEGNEIGRIVENPKEEPTLEEEILRIILDRK